MSFFGKEMIKMKMSEELKLVDIDKLVPYARNARTHSSEQIEQIQASIREFGFVNPVLIDGKFNIIAGHGRILAAKLEGIEEVPCVLVEYLTEAQKKAYMLADNKLALNAGWDIDILKIEIEELQGLNFNIDLTGFVSNEIDLMFQENKEVEEDDFDVDKALEDIIEPIAKRGDIWQLGRHRVMCGDSTIITDVEKLMDGKLADMVCTDPPYNMGYVGAGRTPKNKRQANKILNDNISDDEFKKLLTDVNTNLYTILKDGGSFYIFYKELGKGIFITTLLDSGLTFKQELIWVKNNIVLGGNKYQNIYEPCLFGCKGKSITSWYTGRKERSVIESLDYMTEHELRGMIKILLEDIPLDIIRVEKNLKNDLHPTMKPIRLLAKFIKNSSGNSDVVVDLFGGSGSTLMACEQLNRICNMMELSEKYCEVIINRWEQFTGLKAELIMVN